MSQSDFLKILEKLGKVIDLEKNASKKISRQLFISDIFYLSAVVLTTTSYATILLIILINSLKEFLNISVAVISEIAFYGVILFFILFPAGLICFFISFARTIWKGIYRIIKRNPTEELIEIFAVEEGYFNEAKNIAKEIAQPNTKSTEIVSLITIKQAIEIFNYKIDFLEKADSTVTEIYKSITPIIIGLLVFLSLFNFPVSEISKLNTLENKDIALAVATTGLFSNILIPIIKIITLNKIRMLKKSLCVLSQIVVILEGEVEK